MSKGFTRKQLKANPVKPTAVISNPITAVTFEQSKKDIMTRRIAGMMLAEK